MNHEDVQRLISKGFDVPSDFLSDDYVLIEHESMKILFELSIKALQNGKKPVTIIEDRIIHDGKIEDRRKTMTENAMYLRCLDAISRKIQIFRVGGV